MGHRYQERDVKFYKPETDVPVILPVAECVPPMLQKDYKEFLGSLTEMVILCFNPDVKSKWVKVDLTMVPVPFFKQLFFDLEVIKPFSVREVRHAAPMKCVYTIVHYNIYRKSVLTTLFDKSAVSVKSKAYFRNNEEVVAPPSEENLTAQQKVALARQRATTMASSRKPTSQRQLRCEEREWP